jgi:hypothetical protein
MIMNIRAIQKQGTMNSGWVRRYRMVSFSLAIVFGFVGVLFLYMPEGLFIFFNNLSPLMGFQKSPVHNTSLFVILAAGYMYLVTLLAYYMSKNPEQRVYPLLLVHGKAASSILSLFFFVFFMPYLIILANGLIDGLIAVGVFLLSKKIRGASA